MSRLPKILLIVLCLVHLIVNLIWLNLDQGYPTWDPAGHTSHAYNFARYFQGKLTTNPLTITTYYPPFVYVVTGLVMASVGKSIDTAALLSGTTALLALLVGSYFLATKLTKNEWVGLAVALLLGLLPPIYNESRWFLLDLPMIALVVWSWWALEKSRGFSSLVYALLFAVLASAAVLTKWIAVIFLLIPVVAALIWRTKKGWTKQTTINFATIIFVGLLVCSPWYLTNAGSLITLGKQFSQGEADDVQGFTLNTVLHYSFVVMNLQLGFIPFILFLIAAGFFIYKAPKKITWIVLGYTLLVYLVFTIIGNKSGRYIMPLLPALVFMMSWSIQRWFSKKNWILGTASLLVTAFMAAQYFGLSFGFLPTINYSRGLPFSGWVSFIYWGTDFVTPPDQRTHTLDKIVKLLKEHPVALNQRVFVAADLSELNYPSLVLATTEQQFPVAIFNPGAIISITDQDELQNYLSNFDFILVPTGVTHDIATRNPLIFDQIRDHVIANRGTVYFERAYIKFQNYPGEVLLFSTRP